MTLSSALAPVVVAGPTASGKSAVALALAEALDGEIVCADSRQVYARMSIASAGPSDDERARVPHHLYGVVDPRDTMTAGAWAARCDDVTRDILARGKVPIVVGGTGLYLRAWRVGLQEPSDPAVRARLDDEAARLGPEALHARLHDVDPDAAAAIEPTDRLRVVRALEIFEVKGGPRGAVDLSTLPARPEVAGARWFLVDAPLDVLEPRIRARAEAMFGGGIVAEARALRESVGEGHRLLGTMGTEEALLVESGTMSVEQAVARTTLRTRQYARRQRTWFKKEPWWRRIALASGSDTTRSVVDEIVLSLSLLATADKPG